MRNGLSTYWSQSGGTPITDVESFRDQSGELKMFSIATPFGDTTFRFVERQGYAPIYPGYVPNTAVKPGGNRFSLGHIDHITSNFETMAPAMLWLESVMGFQRFWEIKFHTRDVADPDRKTGSGLKSLVYKDPTSDVKFANNEPWRPFFKSSQIHLFNLDHRGDGIQHAALAVADLMAAPFRRSREENGNTFHGNTRHLLRGAAGAAGTDHHRQARRAPRRPTRLADLGRWGRAASLPAADLHAGVRRHPQTCRRWPLLFRAHPNARETKDLAEATFVRCSKASRGLSGNRAGSGC